MAQREDAAAVPRLNATAAIGVVPDGSVGEQSTYGVDARREGW
jgi:hypothetical protein